MRAASARALALREPAPQMAALWLEAMFEQRMGNAERVADLAQRLLALVEEYALPDGRAVHLWFRGWAEAHLGDPRAGYRLIREGHEEALRLDMRAYAGETLGYATEALIRAGDWLAARQQLDEAMQFADSTGERECLTQLLLLDARIADALGEPARARESVRQAIDEARAQEALWRSSSRRRRSASALMQATRMPGRWVRWSTNSPKVSIPRRSQERGPCSGEQRPRFVESGGYRSLALPAVSDRFHGLQDRPRAPHRLGVARLGQPVDERGEGVALGPSPRGARTGRRARAVRARALPAARASSIARRTEAAPASARPCARAIAASQQPQLRQIHALAQLVRDLQRFLELRLRAHHDRRRAAAPPPHSPSTSLAPARMPSRMLSS